MKRACCWIGTGTGNEGSRGSMRVPVLFEDVQVVMDSGVAVPGSEGWF